MAKVKGPCVAPEPDDFLTALEGQKIISAEVTDDGMHMHLEDGRTVILVGSFCGYIGVLEQHSIQ